MIVITFLGTTSGVPTKYRNHPAIVLEYYSYRKQTLLFDCGECTQLQLMKSGISFMEINNIFITHWHADHFAGLIPLLQTMNLEKRKKELNIFAPEASRFVPLIIRMGYFGLRFPLKYTDVPFEGKELTKILETKEWEIFSIPVLHTVPTVAYAFKEKDKWHINLNRLKELGLKRGRWLKELKRNGKAEYKGKIIRLEDVAEKERGLKVVYTGDTLPCDNVVKIAKNADLLIHDATFFEEEEAKGKYHATVRQAAKIAKKAGVKYLVLTHISRRYTKDDLKKMEDEAKKIFENTVIAHDFMKVVIKRNYIKIQD